MTTEAVYGRPPPDVAQASAGATQLSPLVLGSTAIEALADRSLDRVTVLAPPGTLERRYVLAHALRTLRAGGQLVAAAPKTKGGARLAGELDALGAPPTTESRRHHKICAARAPASLDGLAAAIAEGAPRQADDGLWTQPGVFSWDRLDAGTAVLLDALPAMAGRGADLGCGLGLISRAVLSMGEVSEIALIDLDRRAVELAGRNVPDPRAQVLWRDLRAPQADLAGLDFVVTNPPFHDGGAEDRALGQAFIRRAAEMLAKGGALWLVANRHLPYEAELNAAFARARSVADAGGYKVFEAIK